MQAVWHGEEGPRRAAKSLAVKGRLLAGIVVVVATAVAPPAHAASSAACAGPRAFQPCVYYHPSELPVAFTAVNVDSCTFRGDVATPTCELHGIDSETDRA